MADIDMAAAFSPFFMQRPSFPARSGGWSMVVRKPVRKRQDSPATTVACSDTTTGSLAGKLRSASWKDDYLLTLLGQTR